MSKKTGIIVTVLSVVALCLSIIGLCMNIKQTKMKVTKTNNNDIKYLLYLGTNDKDTYEPYGTPEVCKAKVDEVLTKHF